MVPSGYHNGGWSMRHNLRRGGKKPLKVLPAGVCLIRLCHSCEAKARIRRGRHPPGLDCDKLLT
jgi:hypothetical protein